MSETAQDGDWTDDLEQAGPQEKQANAPAQDGRKKKPVEKPKPVFSDLLSFVGMLTQLIRRHPGPDLLWCPQWYKHPEAISRLAALWDEWEKAVAGHDMSNWWIHHADPHLARLMSSSNGPFMNCKDDKHREAPPLPLGEPDPRLFAGSAFSDPAPEPGGQQTAGAA